MAERELVVPVPLATADGLFNASSHGWCRQPLVDCSVIGSRDLKAHFGRNKRWEYWCVLAPTHILAITIASLDLFVAHDVWVFDRRTQKAISRSFATGGDKGCVLPPNVDGDAHAVGSQLSIDIVQSREGTRLRATIPGASFDVLATIPPGHERMGVVVPWSDTLFQYTVKDVCRPAVGQVVVGDTVTKLHPGEAWAVLDHGRGRWPSEIAWNWGAGCGQTPCGRVIGLQVGGRWTDGTGSTENAVLLDTRLHKISVPLNWEYDAKDFMKPWKVSGGGLDATFVPFFDKHSKVDAAITSSRTDQCFGYWTGTFRTSNGEIVKIDKLIGFAEDVHRRW